MYNHIKWAKTFNIAAMALLILDVRYEKTAKDANMYIYAHFFFQRAQRLKQFFGGGGHSHKLLGGQAFRSMPLP